MRKSGEWMVLFKTVLKNRSKIERKIRQLHPYNLPVITTQVVEVDEKVTKWVEKI